MSRKVLDPPPDEGSMNCWDSVHDRFKTTPGQVPPEVEDNLRIAWPALIRELSKAVKLPGKILDFGCGTGGLAQSLGSLGYTVLGLDPSERMIAEALPKSSDRVSFRRGTLRDLPPEAVFDGIVSCMVLPFVQDLEPCLSQLSARLKKGGTLAFAVFNPEFVSFHSDFTRAGDQILLRIQAEPFEVYPRTADDYRKALTLLGFREAHRDLPPSPAAPEEIPEYLLMAFRKEDR
ncbi:MAG TPA: class I SAM-dependent methyltransferase [Thermoanaerobaculia bacterium]|nr:class I SAM-dependent methyltransferase [Thermoanaerobaculia bacterium]